MPILPDNLRSILQGNPFGETFPRREPPPGLAIDGRTVALTILKDYLAALTFVRPGDTKGQTIPFRVLPDAIHIEWPDHEEDLRFPGIVILGNQRADYDSIGLTSYVEESTRDVYQFGTVLQWMYESIETITLAIYASKRSERRSLIAGIETAFVPSEQLAGLRFRMPDYFNELVCFTIMSRRIVEEPGSAINRRRAEIDLEMRFNVVALINYTTMRPIIRVTTEVDEDTGLTVDLTNDPRAEVLPDP